MTRSKRGMVAKEPRTRPLVAIRGTDEWKAWLDGLAAKRRVPIATLIDIALTDAARAVGYPEPPPRY